MIKNNHNIYIKQVKRFFMMRDFFILSYPMRDFFCCPPCTGRAACAIIVPAQAIPGARVIDTPAPDALALAIIA